MVWERGFSAASDAISATQVRLSRSLQASIHDNHDILPLQAHFKS
jgi:hypothetical protein